MQLSAAEKSSETTQKAASVEGDLQQKRKPLVLHGDRQTGEVLLGRIKSLKRKLLKSQMIELVAPDGCFEWKKHNEDDVLKSEEALKTWWHRDGNEYTGLDTSLSMLHTLWNKNYHRFEGILGFSRGARLAHLVAMLHSGYALFPNLRYVILVSGYGDVPLPSNFPPTSIMEWRDRATNYDATPTTTKVAGTATVDEFRIESCCPMPIPSLHIMGTKDKLIPLQSSRALLSSYVNPDVYKHEGGHHVPMRAADVAVILAFIVSATTTTTPDVVQQSCHCHPLK